LEKTKSFYTNYFNAASSEKYHNTKTNFESYFLEFAGGARLELMYQPAMKDEVVSERIGLVHLAFQLAPKKGWTL
jgi:lactoylglutathione lyase